MKKLSVNVPKMTEARLRVLARRMRLSKSALVRQIVERYLAGKFGVKPGSALDLALDFVGCIEGPGDLSYNKKHMEGYGR